MEASAPSLSILVPVYNERETAVAALREIEATEMGVEREIVVVDDGSTDGTSEILARETWSDAVRFVAHPTNRGKGAAIRTALAAAAGTHACIMDADLEYRPSDIRRLLELVTARKAEVVFGTRAFEAHSAYSFWYVIGNRAVTFAANALFNCWITDMMTCHKLLPTALFRSLDLRENGFAIEAEITARVLRANVVIHEVPITYAARQREQGKKLTAVDGLRVLRTLVRCRVR